MKLRTTLLAAAALVTVSASGAFAAPALTGSFSINGTGNVNGTGVTVDTANSVTFGTVTEYDPGTGTLGSFAQCVGNCGSGGTITISPFSATSPLFSLTNGISFTLNDLTTITRVSAAQASTGIASLTLGGDATYSLAGYAPTNGTFLITTQGNSVAVTFSAFGQAAITSTPEPASLAILGGSLAVLGLVRRRRAN